MSDFTDFFNDQQGFQIFAGNVAGVRQRSQSLAAQRDLLAINTQQLATDNQRLDIERQRMELEQLRVQADIEEKNIRNEQIRQIKIIRNFMADTAVNFEELKKQYP